MTQRFAWFD